MKYCHLSHVERYQIGFLDRIGLNPSAIALELGRHASTITRELSRGSGHKGYRHQQAQRLAHSRATGSRNAKRLCPTLWQQVLARLEIEHSPEQIAASLGCSIMSIYRYVAHDRAAGGQLYKKLRCQRLKRRRYAKGYGGQGKIVNRLDISQRPAHIALRRTVGHWEVDTVVGSTGSW
jgi:transposase, IS30 family